MIVRLLVALLLATAGPARADDPAEGVGYARSLAESTATEEEAHDALRAAWREGGDDAPAARRALVALCVHADPRPGWLATYRDLAADPAVAAPDAERLRRRATESSTWIPSAQARARDELRTMVAKDPRDLSLRFHLARAYMVTGRPEAALPLFASRPDRAVWALGAHLARVAMRSDGDLARGAAEVAAGGYPELAAWMVGKADSGRADAEAWRAVGDGWMARGRYPDAVAAYGSALARNPQDDALRLGLVRAYLAGGDLAKAGTVATTPESERAVHAAEIAGLSPDEAWALAPDEPAVIRARAGRLLDAGKADEAMAILRPLLDGPLDDVTLDIVGRASLAADEPDTALAAWRLAITRASGPSRHDALADGLAAFHGQLAERSKAAGNLAEAERGWRTVVAMRPGWAWAWGGLGGVLWQAGRLEDARAAYVAALAREDDAEGAGEAWRASAVELAVELGDVDGATALLGPEDWTVGGPLDTLRARVAALRTVRAVEAAHADPDGRARALLALVDRDPPDTALARLAAERLSVAGRSAEAVHAWAVVRALLPDDPDVLVGEARALAAAGDPGGARTRLADAVEKGAPAGVARLVEATILRAEGDDLRDAPKGARDALDRYTRSLEIAPEAWTFVALGTLYEAHGQPAAALACFDAGLAADVTSAAAKAGRVRALGALGRWEEARAVAGDDPALLHALGEADLRRRLARIEQRVASGDLEGARIAIAEAARAWPHVAAPYVALARTELAQGRPGAAFEAAKRAVATEPADAAARAVLVDAAEAAGAWDGADAVLASATGGGDAVGVWGARPSELSVESSRQELRFRATLAGAIALSDRGHPYKARTRLGTATALAAGDADRESRLGGAWLALQEPEEAKRAFERALALDPGHAQAARGEANALLAEGRLAAARDWLARAHAADPDPDVARTLAWLERVTLSGNEPVALASADARTDALPLVSVAAGTADADADLGVGASTGAVLADLAGGRDARRERAKGPDIEGAASLAAGAFGHAGIEGEGWLSGALGGAAGAYPVAGPVEVTASALVLHLDDGTDTTEAFAPAFGVRTTPAARMSGALWIGTSPLGAGVATPTARLEGRLRVSPRLDLRLDVSRVPMTETLGSWIGAPDGTWGRTAFSSAGAGFDGKVLAFDYGFRARGGWLDALGMDPVGRLEGGGWGGWRLGGAERWLRVGAAVSGLGHERQVDAFAPGGAAVFAPLAYGLAVTTVDGAWSLGNGVSVCGGLRAGGEVVHAERTERIAPGARPAWGATAGATARFGARWSAGVAVRYDAVTGWDQRGGSLWVAYGPQPIATGGLPAVLGAEAERMGRCVD